MCSRGGGGGGGQIEQGSFRLRHSAVLHAAEPVAMPSVAACPLAAEEKLEFGHWCKENRDTDLFFFSLESSCLGSIVWCPAYVVVSVFRDLAAAGEKEREGYITRWTSRLTQESLASVSSS